MNMKNQNIQEQIVFRQLLPIMRNRNRFLSSDSNLLYQNSQTQGSRIITQEHSQNVQGYTNLHHRDEANPQNASVRKSSKDQETNSKRSNESTPLKGQKRSHALRKQMSETSLSKLSRNRNKSFVQRLNDLKQAQNTLFNRMTWLEYQQSQRITANKVSQQQAHNHIDSIIITQGGSSQLRQSNQNWPHFTVTQSIECQPDQSSSFNPDEDFNPQLLEPDPDIDRGHVYQSEDRVGRVEDGGQSSDEQYKLDVSVIEDQKSIVIPERKVGDFLTQIEMENYLHDDFVPGRFPSNPGLPYQHRYELYYPRSHNDHRINYRVHIKKIQGLRIISYNCAFNIHDETKKDKKIFLDTSRKQKMQQAVGVILKYMQDGYDFILLQQACDPEFQKILVEAIKQFNDLKGEMYFYPQHLDKETKSLRFTSILTKHQVKIGQFNFKIDEIPGHPDYHPRLPIQAFCEFRVKIHDKWENVCIFCAHFKSNRGHQASLSGQVRMKQIDAVQKFGQKFDRFYVIGDVNIPTSSPFDRQNEFSNQRFFDVIYYGISEIRGTFLYRTKGKYVKPQRNDRVWLDRKKQNVVSTSVLMTYHDILLQSCKDLNLDQNKLLQKGGEELTYITVTDHTILDIEIMFLK